MNGKVTFPAAPVGCALGGEPFTHMVLEKAGHQHHRGECGLRGDIPGSEMPGIAQQILIPRVTGHTGELSFKLERENDA